MDVFHHPVRCLWHRECHKAKPPRPACLPVPHDHLQLKKRSSSAVERRPDTGRLAPPPARQAGSRRHALLTASTMSPDRPKCSRSFSARQRPDQASAEATEAPARSTRPLAATHPQLYSRRGLQGIAWPRRACTARANAQLLEEGHQPVRGVWTSLLGGRLARAGLLLSLLPLRTHDCTTLYWLYEPEELGSPAR